MKTFESIADAGPAEALVCHTRKKRRTSAIESLEGVIRSLDDDWRTVGELLLKWTGLTV